ncbi:CarD family transcriptional regulator [Candidatus Formimonas warabiya]|uniref:CarD family transcriptional regulator n=1 Tax=Formimonas warabiya TaxID=1761012 RepID=A0A3G1KXI3_FORW1|nr:CarD family transcriptional regulator [Candidatus Formimonas warabiya]ATW27079.1 CarD family transcriptional regulator [Candidatus Formimonas warabiya]
MFRIGDKVVYPMHGAGVIEAIEEKEILGEKRSYYVMKIPIGDMKVMVPMDNVEEIGLRQVIDDVGFQKVMAILNDRKSPMSSNWNRRYRANMEKIKSGNIYEVAEVVRNLMLRDREKSLSSGEKKMLDYARQILISELVLSKGQEEGKVLSMIEGVLGGISKALC